MISGASFSGSPVLSATPLTPTLTASAEIDVELGGQLTVGPGAATDKAGVIAGISGDLYPLDAEFGPVFPPGTAGSTPACGPRSGFSRSLSVTAKAWVGKWATGDRIVLDTFTGTTPYQGSPWHLPTGCEKTTVPQPSQTVLGPGVSKVSDTIGGTANQWGHVQGFAPGKTTWVLSTGLIADALGTPDRFASTGLGQPGDDGLTELAGQPTHDPAFYEVTVVPRGACCTSSTSSPARSTPSTSAVSTTT